MKDTEYIDELIGKYLAGEASPDEAIALDDWKNQSKGNLEYFEQCLRIFEISSGQKFPRSNVNQAWKKLNLENKQQETKVVSFNNNRWYWRIAASLVLLVGLTAALVYLLRSPGTENLAYEADNTTKQVALTDQSNINIAPHSRLEVDQNFGHTHRTVKLKGSAYFDVTHDDKLPFTVDAGKVYVKDIGTKFNISSSANNDTLVITVDEGTVLLFDSLGTSLTLNAPQEAIYVKSLAQVITPTKETSPVPLHFDFESTSLNDVINQVETGYKVNIGLENPALGRCLITTSFTGQDIETVMTVITETLGLTYVRTPEGYLIKGQQCNQ